MSDPKTPVDVDKELKEVRDLFESALATVNEVKIAQIQRSELFGKKSRIARLKALLGQVSSQERAAVGAKINAQSRELEARFEAHVERLTRAARDAELNARPFDLSLPGRLELGRGHAHPIHQVRDDLLAIFRDLGFAIAEGPEVELEENNFTKLNFPPDHPATDMQDSFWVGSKTLLRTHTSNVQIREMLRNKPPLAVVSAGRVYRRDDDVTHSPMFHQIEGFMVDEGVSLANLKGVLTAFAERLYGPGTKVRFRPSFFPFVEPGVEFDAGCVFCKQADGTYAGCRICKHTGWIELLGAGMIHPEVFRHCGIDSERYTGFAFGMGIDRVAMLRYGIPNIRLMFENDPRMLAQF
jgi:phenylalanyl-tRNA synthetase alpha chain